jgi:hypothetical protein
LIYCRNGRLGPRAPVIAWYDVPEAAHEIDAGSGVLIMTDAALALPSGRELRLRVMLTGGRAH